ncbi:hypothetical protein ACHAXS_007497 [Conticribra weissflogii]
MSAPIAASALLSTSMKWAVGGWTFFILENFILSENRTFLISQVGDDGYHIAYGTLSTAAMSSVFYGYFKKVKNASPLLWKIGGPAPLPAKMGSFVCLSLGLGMASQVPPKLQIPVHYDGGELVSSSKIDNSLDKPTVTPSRTEGGWKVRCPFDFTDNHSKQQEATGDVHGLDRVSRHPGLWSFGLLGLGNALLVPSVPQRAWLAMPAMVAIVGGAHTDSRFRRGMGGELPVEYDRVTSNVPFVAMFSGAQGNVLEVLRDFGSEVKLLNAAIAVGAAGVFVLRKGRGAKLPLR